MKNEFPALTQPKLESMYYTSEFFQVLGNTKNKPIDIILLGGSVSLSTHPGDETSIAAENIEDGSLMPLLHETGSGIRIDRQSLFSFIPPNNDLRLKIYVPENSRVNILMRGGFLRLHGNFKSLRARNDAGKIKCDLLDLTVEEQAKLSVFAGEIELKNAIVNGRKRGINRISLPAGKGEIQARVSLGEIRLREAIPAWS